MEIVLYSALGIVIHDMSIRFGESLWLGTSPNQTKSLEDVLQKPGFLEGWEGGSLGLI